MIDLDGVQDALYAWAAQKLACTVIWADQGEHRPAKPYASLDLKAPTRVGVDEIRVQDDGTVQVVGLREAQVSVNTYGQDSFDRMLVLQSSLELPSVQESLRKLGVIYVGTSQVRDISAENNSRNESRAQMDVQIRLTSILTDTETGVIEKVEMTNAIDGKTELIEP